MAVCLTARVLRTRWVALRAVGFALAVPLSRFASARWHPWLLSALEETLEV